MTIIGPLGQIRRAKQCDEDARPASGDSNSTRFALDATARHVSGAAAAAAAEPQGALQPGAPAAKKTRRLAYPPPRPPSGALVSRQAAEMPQFVGAVELRREEEERANADVASGSHFADFGAPGGASRAPSVAPLQLQQLQQAPSRGDTNLTLLGEDAGEAMEVDGLPGWVVRAAAAPSLTPALAAAGARCFPTIHSPLWHIAEAEAEQDEGSGTVQQGWEAYVDGASCDPEFAGCSALLEVLSLGAGRLAKARGRARQYGSAALGRPEEVGQRLDVPDLASRLHLTARGARSRQAAQMPLAERADGVFLSRDDMEAKEADPFVLTRALKAKIAPELEALRRALGKKRGNLWGSSGGGGGPAHRSVKQRLQRKRSGGGGGVAVTPLRAQQQQQQPPSIWPRQAMAVPGKGDSRAVSVGEVANGPLFGGSAFDSSAWEMLAKVQKTNRAAAEKVAAASNFVRGTLLEPIRDSE